MRFLQTHVLLIVLALGAEALAASASPSASTSTVLPQTLSDIFYKLGYLKKLADLKLLRTQPKSPLYSSLLADNWEFTLSPSQLAATSLYHGFSGRLKLVLAKLLAGETVRIGALGGSVTVGRWASPGNDWFALTTKWLARAFPKATIIARNGGVSGTKSMFMERCVQHFLDADADLVFYEYTLNDDPRGAEVGAYERLLRMLLSRDYAHASPVSSNSSSGSRTLQAPPAVIMLNMWRCCPNFHTDLAPYKWLEDEHNILAQYYTMPSVSLRGALHDAFRTGKGIYAKGIDAFFPPNERGSRSHPNDEGSVLLADAVIYAFYVALAQLEQQGITAGDMELMARPMPPPMVSKEDSHVNVACLTPHQLKDVVAKADGWDYREDVRGKPGYIATKSGAVLTLQIDTTIPSSMTATTNEEGDKRGLAPVVHLGLLKSYEIMGTVDIACTEGCKCEPRTINTHDPKDTTSQTIYYPVDATPAHACLISLTVSSSTTSGQHKLKLTNVAVSMRPVQAELAPAGSKEGSPDNKTADKKEARRALRKQ